MAEKEITLNSFPLVVPIDNSKSEVKPTFHDKVTAAMGAYPAFLDDVVDEKDEAVILEKMILTLGDEFVLTTIGEVYKMAHQLKASPKFQAKIGNALNHYQTWFSKKFGKILTTETLEEVIAEYSK